MNRKASSNGRKILDTETNIKKKQKNQTKKQQNQQQERKKIKETN